MLMQVQKLSEQQPLQLASCIDSGEKRARLPLPWLGTHCAYTHSSRNLHTLVVIKQKNCKKFETSPKECLASSWNFSPTGTRRAARRSILHLGKYVLVCCRSFSSEADYSHGQAVGSFPRSAPTRAMFVGPA